MIEMKKILKITTCFVKDEGGATLVEYTILLGIVMVAALGTILAVGMWVSTNLTTLCTTNCTPS